MTGVKKVLQFSLAAVMAAGFLAASPPVVALAPANDESDESAGREAIAYSHAMQAYMFAYPLLISDREIMLREQLKKPVAHAPIAKINRLGHMRALASAKSDMPYSPNNDTLYTGVTLDLKREPIILAMPEIKDRFAIVQMTNAYIENQPYVYSPRANGGDAAWLGFVAPDWTGELPEGVTEVRLDTNMAFLAIRIAVYDEDDLSPIHAYQDKISLTALSDWDNGPSSTPPQIPEPKTRTKYNDEFAYFRKAADLLADFPPPERHRAINASLWRIGLFPGEPYRPEELDPATRRGVERALKDGPKAIEYLRRNRGKRFPTGWDAGRYADNFVFDYAARAAIALVGLMGNDPQEAIYFYTYFDSEGEALNGDNRYRLHLEPEDIPDINSMGFWSVTMYDGVTFRFIENPIDRYSIGSKSNLKRNPDGSIDIWIQPDAPEEAKRGNWLPSPKGDPFRVTFRIYSPKDHIVESFYDIELALPPLVRTDP